MWSPSQPMTFVVLSVVVVLMNKIALRISVRINDWTAESAIISRKEIFLNLVLTSTRCFGTLVISAICVIVQDDGTEESKCDCLFGEYAEDPDGPNGRYGPVTGNNREEILAVCYYSS